MSSEQPTHHGYAVNVKDRMLYADVPNRDALSDDDAQLIWEQHAEMFWADAQEVAHEHGFRDVFSEGRMGGWAVPSPQPATDDMWPEQVDAWVAERFRPFERDLLALLADARDEFRADLIDAAQRAADEPGERAHWEARDVETR